MADLRPIEGERTLLKVGVLTVTSVRVRLHDAGDGHADVIGFLLDSVTGCALTHATHPTLLVLAVLALLGGAVLDRVQGALVIGIALASIFVVAYLVTRQQVLRISSPSTHMDVRVRGASLEEAIGIVETIEHAKLAWHIQNRR